MKTYFIDPRERGWMSISGDVKVIVAHYKDGHKEKMGLMDYVSNPRRRKNVVQIDCYTEDEKHLAEV